MCDFALVADIHVQISGVVERGELPGEVLETASSRA